MQVDKQAIMCYNIIKIKKKEIEEMINNALVELCHVLHQSRNRITCKQWQQLSRSARNIWFTANLIHANSRKLHNN